MSLFGAVRFPQNLGGDVWAKEVVKERADIAPDLRPASLPLGPLS